MRMRLTVGAAALGVAGLLLCTELHPEQTRAEGANRAIADQGTTRTNTDLAAITDNQRSREPIALPSCGSVAEAPARYTAGRPLLANEDGIAASVTNCVTYSMFGGDDPHGNEVNFSTGYYFNVGEMLNPDTGDPCLGLDNEIKPWPFVAIANSNRGTLVRIAVQDLPTYGIGEGDVLGEYYSSPENMGRSPSRTTIDAYGNIWITNRNEMGFYANDGLGSVSRYGLVLGGTRVDASGNPDPTGGYLQGPFDYCTCEDRDGDGLIRTSRGYPHTTGAPNADFVPTMLPWTNAGDLDVPGGVATAEDECITAYVRVAGTGTRFIGIDKRGDVWTGGTGNMWFELVDGDTAQVVPGSAFFGQCAGYGGLVDKHDRIWSAWGLMRYDVPLGNPGGGTPQCLDINSYGVAIDPQTNNIWITHWDANNSLAAEVDPSTNTIVGAYGHGGFSAQGLVVDTSGNVWVAHSGTTVGRLQTDGTYIDSVPMTYGAISGSGTTGVAVDTNGKVWGANIGTNNAMRIDPNDLTDSNAGSVDLVVDLGDLAHPYNYSDMTGSVLLHAVAPQGHWTVIHDGGSAGAPWGVLSWNAVTDPGTSVTVRVRASDSVVPSGPWLTVSNGVPFTGVNGRYLQVQVSLHRDAKTGGQVMLCDLTICQSASCAVVANDEVLCDIDGTGTIDYSFDLTNLSGVPVKHLLVVPPAGVTATPNIITNTPSLPDGATMPVNLSFSGVDTSEEFCFELILLSPEGEECCAIEICLNCACLQVVAESIECVDSTSFIWSIDVHNNSGFPGQYVFLIPDDPNVDFSPNFFNVNVPAGGVASISTKVTGATPLQLINVLMTIHDPDLEHCCTLERALRVPDCDGKIVPDSCHVTAKVNCCLPQGQAEQTTMLTICNNSDTAATYAWDISALPLGGDCTAEIPPDAFVPNNGVVVVDPGDCESIPIVIWCDYLYGQGLGSVACLQVNIENFNTGELLKCIGMAGSTPQGVPCVIVADPKPVELVLPGSAPMPFTILAGKNPPSWFLFNIDPGHENMGIGGLPPGEPWWAYRWLDPGAMIEVVADVRFVEHTPNVHDVLFYHNGHLLAAGAARIVHGNGSFGIGDFNQDGVVDVSDLLLLLSLWGSCPGSPGCAGDLNNDGVVDTSDLLILLANWG